MTLQPIPSELGKLNFLFYQCELKKGILRKWNKPTNSKRVLEGDLFHGLLVEGHAVRDWFLHLHLLIDILFVWTFLSGRRQWRWRRRVRRRTKVVVFLVLKENVLLDVLVYLFWEALKELYRGSYDKT